MASVLANTQMSMVAPKPITASCVSKSTNFGKHRRPDRRRHFADHKADHAQAQRLLQDHGAMVRLWVPISLSTAIRGSCPASWW